MVRVSPSSTTEAIARAEPQSDEPEMAFTDADRATLDAVLDQLVESTALSSHGGRCEALDVHMRHVQEHHLQIYAKFPRLF